MKRPDVISTGSSRADEVAEVVEMYRQDADDEHA
jgi:hypothetical protein